MIFPETAMTCRLQRKNSDDPLSSPATITTMVPISKVISVSLVEKEVKELG